MSKIECICGKLINPRYFGTHIKCKKHIVFVEKYKKENNNKEPDISHIKPIKINKTDDPEYRKRYMKNWYDDNKNKKKQKLVMKKQYYNNREKLLVRKRIYRFYKRNNIIRTEMTYKNKRKFFPVLKEIEKLKKLF